MQLVKNRLAKTNWYILDNTSDNSPNGIPFFFDGLDVILHFLGHFGIGTTNGIGFNFGKVQFLVGLVQFHLSNLGDKGVYLDVA